MTGLALTLRDATDALTAVSATPRLDAELLMAHALGIDRSAMLLRQHDLDAPAGFAAMLARRVADEPVAYITGMQAFWDLDLHVTPDVLIPRSDSETLIEVAIAAFAAGNAPARILDLGTGSGALLLAALSVFGDAQGVGLDASAAALAVASGNAKRLGLEQRATFERRDWTLEGWADGLGQFDLILCNPPYIEDETPLAPMVARHEPHSALFAGPDGLRDYRILLKTLEKLLKTNGFAVFEIGFNQSKTVAKLGTDAGFTSELTHDLSGNPRVLRFSLGITEPNR
ncbi:MAG: peptide chain release factor N(5)-glutamine methyltransferase [Sphingorhabdus sp.]